MWFTPNQNYYHCSFQIEYTEAYAELGRILPSRSVVPGRACLDKFKYLAGTGRTALWERTYRYETDGTFLEPLMTDVIAR